MASFISQRRYFGAKVVFFGNVSLNQQAAGAADSCVATVESLRANLPDANVILRNPDLENLFLLRLLSMDYTDRIRQGTSTSLAFNLACSAGAIFLGFPLLGVVILSNVGTFVSYLRSTRSLKTALRYSN
jgi:cation transport ATPase